MSAESKPDVDALARDSAQLWAIDQEIKGEGFRDMGDLRLTIREALRSLREERDTLLQERISIGVKSVAPYVDQLRSLVGIADVLRDQLAEPRQSNVHQAEAYSSLNAAYQQLAEEHAKALEDNDAAMKAPKITDFEAQRSDPVESPNADDAYTVLDMPPDLHPQTKCLVWGFANALAAKLHKAEQKYGYSDGWRTTDWIASGKCREKLMEHIAKGDPRDVAAYCAFLWWHNASTVSNDAACSAEDSELAALVRKSYVLSCGDYGPEHEIRWLFELPMPAADGERFKKLAARAAQEERK